MPVTMTEGEKELEFTQPRQGMDDFGEMTAMGNSPSLGLESHALILTLDQANISGRPGLLATQNYM